MIKIKIEGLEEATRKLEDLSRKAQELDGKHEVAMSEMFPPAFMTRHTDFSSFSAMLNASGFKVETKEDFAAIPNAEWDAFVTSRTRFGSWKEMKDKGVQEYAIKKLGL